MSDNLRAQIYNNLIIKDTEDLLEIWQSGTTSEWNEEVFEFVKEILMERLGYVPPQSTKAQVLQILAEVEEHLDNNELDQALSKCEFVIQMNPNSAIAYNYCGEIYDQLGQLENAIINYQRALQIDPDLEDAWDNMLTIEPELEEEFEESLTKQHLDQALEYAYSSKPEQALEECEKAKQSIPRLAFAYNYLGVILQILDQLEPAIDSYLIAIQLNPRFYVARENLANTRVKLEEELYLRAAKISSDEIQEVSETNTEFDESLDSETIENGIPIPGWEYLDANAFLLPGWAGHRIRPGRSGYDPLDADFELAHMEGVIIRRLMTGKFRTRNPIFLIFMTCMGVLYFLYGLFGLTPGNWFAILTGIISSPYLIIGIALLVNVYLSLRIAILGEYEDNGYTFF